MEKEKTKVQTIRGCRMVAQAIVFLCFICQFFVTLNIFLSFSKYTNYVKCYQFLFLNYFHLSGIYFLRTFLLRDDTHDVHENCQIFKIPDPLSIYVQNSSTALTLDVQFQTNLPSLLALQMITSQLKENIIQDDYYMLSGPSFRLALVFRQKQSSGGVL